MAIQTLIRWQAIRPKPWRTDVLEAAILAGLQDQADRMRKDYERSVANWRPENRPQFDAALHLNVDRGSAEIEIRAVGTDHQVQIYRFVDLGTKPHVILPRNAKILRFPTSPFMQSKTVPGRLRTRSNWKRRPFGRTPAVNWVYTRRVNHPGTQPRNFTKQVLDRNRASFTRAITSAFTEGLRRMTE